jgi:hypothetical protein
MEPDFLDLKGDLLDAKNIELYQELIMTANIDEAQRLTLLSRLGDKIEKCKQLACSQGDVQTQPRMMRTPSARGMPARKSVQNCSAVDVRAFM